MSVRRDRSGSRSVAGSPADSGPVRREGASVVVLVVLAGVLAATAATATGSHRRVRATQVAHRVGQVARDSLTRTSALTVDLVVPGVTQPPSISGVTEVGQTLTASTGEWLGTVPLTYTYQWLHCDSGGGSCTEISGATSATYVLASASVGFRLRVRVTASNTVGA